MSLFRPAREARGMFYEPPIPPTYQGGMGGGGLGNSVSVDASLQNDAVWACVRLLADVVSMLPLQAYRRKGKVRTLLDTQPALLVKPSDDAELPEWLWMLIASLTLRGNGYARVVGRDAYGLPVQTELLAPDSVKPFTSDAGRRQYRLNGRTVLGAEDVLHFRAFRWPGQLEGLSPIRYHALTILTDVEANRFGLGFFRDGAHPSSVLSSDQPIDQSDADAIKARFKAAISGRDVAVLGAGVTYQAIQVKPEESQFLATQKYGATKIARIFGVPAAMIDAESGSSMTYSNVEQRSIELLTYAVQPWLTRIEAAISALYPRGTEVRFDVDALLRTDHETLARSLATRIAAKFLTPDEAREQYDLPPLTQQQKDELDLVPLTVTPVGTPKALPTAPPVGEGAADVEKGAGNGGQGS